MDIFLFQDSSKNSGSLLYKKMTAESSWSFQNISKTTIYFYQNWYKMVDEEFIFLKCITWILNHN